MCGRPETEGDPRASSALARNNPQNFVVDNGF